MSLYSVCRNIRKITDAELAEAEEMAKSQCAYFSPLKMATQGRQHALGKHNLEVISRIRFLRDIINHAAIDRTAKE